MVYTLVVPSSAATIISNLFVPDVTLISPIPLTLALLSVADALIFIFSVPASTSAL